MKQIKTLFGILTIIFVIAFIITVINNSWLFIIFSIMSLLTGIITIIVHYDIKKDNKELNQLFH
jgi:uncharacterized protein (DUF58 family)